MKKEEKTERKNNNKRRGNNQNSKRNAIFRDSDTRRFGDFYRKLDTVHISLLYAIAKSR